MRWLIALCLVGCGSAQAPFSASLDALAASGTPDPQTMSGLILGSPVAEPAPPAYEDEVGDEQSYVSNPCPADMKLVSGNYCPSIIQNCINLDKTIHNANGYVRCLEFAPTQCLTPKEQKPHMRFCMDKYEWPNKVGEKPGRMLSWYDMKRNCEGIGKRLCEDREWSQACEGNPNNDEIVAYPYGNVRDATKCNIDKQQRSWFDASKSPMTPDIVERLDQSVPSGSMPGCVSGYEIFDMTGNMDEFVVNGSGKPYVSGLMGGHWVMGARNRCRPKTIAHGPTFAYYAEGGRCCKNVE
jgi:formylglycine-generating enzyme